MLQDVLRTDMDAAGSEDWTALYQPIESNNAYVLSF